MRMEDGNLDLGGRHQAVMGWSPRSQLVAGLLVKFKQAGTKGTLIDGCV